jgi:hypothetical protein
VVRKIRITRTEVWEYDPDLTSDFYKNENITTLEEALTADKEDVDLNDTALSEIADEPVSIEDFWEIIEVDEDD